MMDDASGLAEALLGLSEFRVLAVAEFPDELWISVETTTDVVGCPRCGVRALAHERIRVDIRDLVGAENLIRSCSAGLSSVWKI